MNSCSNCKTNKVHTVVTVSHPHVNRQIGLCVNCSRAKTRGWLKIEVLARKVVFVKVGA